MTLYKGVKIYHLESENKYFCFIMRGYYENTSIDYLKHIVDLVDDFILPYFP